MAAILGQERPATGLGNRRVAPFNRLEAHRRPPGRRARPVGVSMLWRAALRGPGEVRAQPAAGRIAIRKRHRGARIASHAREDRLISGSKVKHSWCPLWQVISSHTARHAAATLLQQVSRNNKALAKLVPGHAEVDVNDRYAKDKARLLAPAVPEAWQEIFGDWYDSAPHDEA